MTDPIRVMLISSDANPTAGWGHVTSELSAQLASRQDIEFQLHLPLGEGVPEGLPFADRIHRTLPPWTSSFGRQPLRAIKSLYRVLGYRPTGQFDVVHTLVEFPYGILASTVARQLRVPYMITTAGTYSVLPFHRWIDAWQYRPALRNAAVVTAPSAFTAGALVEASGVQRSVELIGYGVNSQRFNGVVDTARVRRALGIPERAQLVIGVGGLKPRKGFDTLIDAFKDVVRDLPRAHLAIVGEGTERIALQHRVRTVGLDGRVTFTGRVSADILEGLYKTCDVYALLTRNVDCHFEGYGLVYLEAAAAGKPAVAAQAGGAAEAVLDGETGIVVPSEDPRSAASAIVRLLRDDQLRRRMGHAARLHASRHTWERYADEIVALYRRITAEH